MPRASLKLTQVAAAWGFGRGQGGEVGVSPRVAASRLSAACGYWPSDVECFRSQVPSFISRISCVSWLKKFVVFVASSQASLRFHIVASISFSSVPICGCSLRVCFRMVAWFAVEPVGTSVLFATDCLCQFVLIRV